MSDQPIRYKIQICLVAELEVGPELGSDAEERDLIEDVKSGASDGSELEGLNEAIQQSEEFQKLFWDLYLIGANHKKNHPLTSVKITPCLAAIPLEEIEDNG